MTADEAWKMATHYSLTGQIAPAEQMLRFPLEVRSCLESL